MIGKSPAVTFRATGKWTREELNATERPQPDCRDVKLPEGVTPYASAPKPENAAHATLHDTASRLTAESPGVPSGSTGGARLTQLVTAALGAASCTSRHTHTRMHFTA